MTVLSKYVRLETPGLWREGPGAQRREVVVQLGDASLTFLDLRSGIALSHWSLPAVVRLNPGDLPALYAPGPGQSGEAVEIAEAAMIDAIETVRRAIGAARPRPGRLRAVILGGSVAAVLALGVLWLPEAAARHAASVAPQAARIGVGRIALEDLARVTGAPCTAPAGLRAARRLGERLFGAGGGEVVVVRDGIGGAVQLPGRIMVIDLRTITAIDAPEVPAAHLLVARMRAEASDPLLGVLRWAGLSATLRLLATGTLSREAVEGYGPHLLTRRAAPVDTARLAARAGDIGLDLGPYLRATGAGAAPQGGEVSPVLSDADWISLQGICDG
jgi:hypothetical protein